MKLHWVSAQRLVKIATLANVVITRFWGEVVAVTNNVGLFAISYRVWGVSRTFGLAMTAFVKRFIISFKTTRQGALRHE